MPLTGEQRTHCNQLRPFLLQHLIRYWLPVRSFLPAECSPCLTAWPSYGQMSHWTSLMPQLSWSSVNWQSEHDREWGRMAKSLISMGTAVMDMGASYCTLTAHPGSEPCFVILDLGLTNGTLCTSPTQHSLIRAWCQDPSSPVEFWFSYQLT